MPLIVHHDPVLADGRAIVGLPRDALPGHIPTLADALDACAGAIVDIEIKNLPGEPDFDPSDRLADAVVALLGRTCRVTADVADLVVPPRDDRSLPDRSIRGSRRAG